MPLSPLEFEIRSIIAQEGPLSIGHYMAVCLTHPQHGYYTTGTPVGGRASAAREGGDFITAPEVSQMFGELIGVWCMEQWENMGSPAAFNLVEIGPGRGSLMKDLLRAARTIPDFLAAAHVHLIEVSPTLAEQQSLTLEDTTPRITWLRDLDGLPDQPTILIANELLDALPIRQWVKNGDIWLERAVGLIDGKLAFTTRSTHLEEAALPKGNETAHDGDIFETAPAREAYVANVAALIAQNAGSALFIDYGHEKSKFEDTFQAIKDHSFAHPLENPGTADLTSHVDFEPLIAAAAMNGCQVSQLQTQAKFLFDLGLLERAGVLGAGRDKVVQDALRAAVERLAAPTQMGDLFKVFRFASNR